MEIKKCHLSKSISLHTELWLHQEPQGNASEIAEI